MEVSERLYRAFVGMPPLAIVRRGNPHYNYFPVVADIGEGFTIIPEMDEFSVMATAFSNGTMNVQLEYPYHPQSWKLETPPRGRKRLIGLGGMSSYDTGSRYQNYLWLHVFHGVRYEGHTAVVERTAIEAGRIHGSDHNVAKMVLLARFADVMDDIRMREMETVSDHRP